MKNDKTKEILRTLDAELARLKIESPDIISQAESSIGLCKIAFAELKGFILENGFANQKDEIRFFKTVKPQVFSKLIFYVELLRIETHRPRANKKYQKKYLMNEFQLLQKYLNEKHEFYQYYKAKQICLDSTYFTRSNEILFISSKNYNYLLDPDFSTSHDELVAHIIAYEQLENYIDNEIRKLKNNFKFWQKQPIKKYNSEYEWTDSKVSLIELIYALNSSKSINNGKSDIKELIHIFEQAFNIRLDKSYRTFIDIQRRKKERTKFLDHLKQSLLKRMEDEDNALI